MDRIRQPETRIIPIGQPIDDGSYLFEGSSDDARVYLAEMPNDQRSAVIIWTPGHVFSVEQFEAEIEHREHDPFVEL